MGRKMIMNPRRGRETFMENSSGSPFAASFGMVSPKISTITVIAAVEIAAAAFSLMRPRSASSLMNSCVLMVEAARFTRLLPIRMLESALSKLSEI